MTQDFPESQIEYAGAHAFRPSENDVRDRCIFPDCNSSRTSPNHSKPEPEVEKLKLVTAERAREIMEAGGSVHRDQRYSGDYRYIVDDMGTLVG